MTRKQIKDYTRLYQAVLGLTNWNIDIYFRKPPKSRFADDRFTTVAVTYTNCIYKDASIEYDPLKLKVVDEEVIIHELLHILLSDFTQTAKETSKEQKSIEYYNEQMVSQLARIMLRLIYPKKKIIV